MSKVKLYISIALISTLLISCRTNVIEQEGENIQPLPPVSIENPYPEASATHVPEYNKVPTGIYAPVPQRRYLIHNNLEFTIESINKVENQVDIHIDYLVIKGLKNKEIEDRINKEIYMLAENMSQLPAHTTGEKSSAIYSKDSLWGGFTYTASYNNVLCIVIHSGSYIKETHEYSLSALSLDLTTGKRLELEDIFVENADYIKMVNEKVKMYILRNNLEEDILTRPFISIHRHQPFYITHDKLYIVFGKESPEFHLPYGTFNIEIPFNELDGAIDIYDKFIDNNNIIYTTDKIRVFE